MKKIFGKVCLLCASATMMFGCSGQGGENSGNDNPKEEEKTMTEEEKLYQNIWEAKTIYNESCVCIENANGKKVGKLVYKASEIIEVRNYTLQKVYDKSEYKIENGNIVLTDSSTMPFLTQANVRGDVVPEEIGGTHPTTKTESGKILFTEGVGIIMNQIMVTYKTNETWFGTVPAKKGEMLPNLRNKLKNKEDINYVCYGDSIYTGANTSGYKGIEPFLDIFPLAFANEMTRVYGSNVNYTNTAKGGEASAWGKANVDSCVNSHNPDLVVIGFGMNDGCDAFKVPVPTFIENLTFMIESIQSRNENAEIILCATIVANPDSPQAYMQEQYLPAMLELEGSYNGVAVLDMTTFSKELLTRKNSLDLYANNINHPDDFMARCYVSNLMNVIEEK